MCFCSRKSRDIGKPPRGSIATKERTLNGSVRGSFRGSQHYASRSDFRRNKIGVSTEEESNDDSGSETLGCRKVKRDYARTKSYYARQHSTDDETEHKRINSYENRTRSRRKRDLTHKDDYATKTEESDDM